MPAADRIRGEAEAFQGERPKQRNVPIGVTI